MKFWNWTRTGAVRPIYYRQDPSVRKDPNGSVKLLADDKIPIKQNTQSGLMHLKVTVADQIVINYTGAVTYNKRWSPGQDQRSGDGQKVGRTV